MVGLLPPVLGDLIPPAMIKENEQRGSYQKKIAQSHQSRMQDLMGKFPAQQVIGI